MWQSTCGGRVSILPLSISLLPSLPPSSPYPSFPLSTNGHTHPWDRYAISTPDDAIRSYLERTQLSVIDGYIGNLSYIRYISSLHLASGLSSINFGFFYWFILVCVCVVNVYVC